VSGRGRDSCLAVWVGVVVVSALVAAACGDDDQTTGTAAVPATDPEPDGGAARDDDGVDAAPEVGASTTDPAELATASLDGTYNVTRTIVDTNLDSEPVAERVYEFSETTCDAAGCRSEARVWTFVTTEDGEWERRGDLLIPLAGDGATYSGTTTSDEACPNGPGHGYTVTFALEIVPTSATRTETEWVVASFEGTGRVDTTPDRGCFPDGSGGLTDDGADPFEVSALAGTRDDTSS
jgi:hypothetical protein